MESATTQLSSASQSTTTTASEQETRAMAMFKRLCDVTTEPAHHDFKESCNIDTKKKKKDFARNVVAMYNGIGDRYEATNGMPNSASYLLIGVKNQSSGDGTGPVNMLVPLVDRPDPASYQQVLLARVTPFIEVLYHDIRLDNDLFGLIEVRRGSVGPAAVVSTPSETRSAEQYTRVDGRNVSKKEIGDPALWDKVDKLFDRNCDRDCWVNIEPSLKEGRTGAIHVLVTQQRQNGSTSNDTPPERDLVGMALGSLPWNVVIDLDSESCSSGALDRISRDISIVSYDEVENLLTSEMELDFFLSKTLWILASGCSVSGKQGNFLQPISDFLTRLFKSIMTKKPQPVLCVSLVTNLDPRMEVPRILELLEDSYNSAAENIGEASLTFVNVVTEPRFKALFTGEETDSQRLQAYTIPLAQFAAGMVQCYGVDTGVDLITFPNVTGAPATILGADYINNMSQSIELYHSDYGRIREEQDRDDGLLKDDIVLKFLQGGQITPEALYISEMHSRHVYITRTKAVKLEKSIKKRLRLRPFYRRKQDTVFTLKHLSSAGGTTAGRSILWNLRHDYPCMEVKSIDENLYTSLTRISKEAGLPLLLLFDRSFVEVDLVDVRNRLSSTGTNAVLLHVHRVTKTQADQLARQREDDYTALMTTILDPDEIGGFRALYQAHAQEGSLTKVKEEATKTFHFGLYAFAEQYLPKIEEHVVRCIQHCSDQQKAVLRLSCLLARYTESPILMPTPLVALILQLPVHETMDDLETALGEVGEILVPRNAGYGAVEDGFDLPHACVLDKVWQTAMPCSPETPNPIDLLQQSLRDFSELKRRHGCIQVLISVEDQLFVERRSHRYDSLFISNFGQGIGYPETLRLMGGLANSFEESSHFWLDYTRCLKFRVKNCVQAFDKIKPAIELAQQHFDKERRSSTKAIAETPSPG